MNLWMRLLLYALTARWRPGLAMPDGQSVLHFRAWPTDLDTSLHVNNGRYLALMDQGRLDFMVGAGLFGALVRNSWTPIASSVLIRFRREIRLWQRFRLETRLVWWDQSSVVMAQSFVLEGGPRDGQVAALAMFKGGIYDRQVGGFVPVARLMSEVGVSLEPPAPTPEVIEFLGASATLR